MTQLYLHIGMPKTATTTIQHGLWLNQDALLQQGYYLPQTGSVRGITKVPIFAHHTIAREVNHRNEAHNPFAGTIAALIHEVERQPHDRILVSSEVLSFSHRLTPEHIAWLRAQLPAQWPIQVIVYVRRQDEMLHSWWAQLVKLGRTRANFEAMLPGQLANFRAADYDRLLGYWEGNFGRENIHLRVFEDVVKQEHIFANLLGWYGLTDLSGVQMPNPANTTPSEKTLRFIQQVSAQLESSAEEADSTADLDADEATEKLARTRYYHHVLMAFADEFGWNETKVNHLTPALRDQIMAYYADSNQRVAQRYLGRDALFVDAPRERPVTVGAAVAFTADEMEALVYASARRYVALEVDISRLRDRRQAQASPAPNNTSAARLQTRISDLEAELALRRSLPLARIGELLGAAQREVNANGIGGLLTRAGLWLRGERRTR